jgi:hypothetical protein
MYMVAGPPSICGVGSISCLEFTRAALTNLRVCDAGMYVYPRSGVCLSARARCTYPWRRRRPPASPGVACMQGSAGGHPFLQAGMASCRPCLQEWTGMHSCPQECIPVDSMFDTQKSTPGLAGGRRRRHGRVCICTYIHRSCASAMQVCIYTPVQMCVYIHTYIHACMHTYIHTHLVFHAYVSILRVRCAVEKTHART